MENSTGRGNYLLLREFPLPRIEQLWRDFLNRAECPAHYNSPEFFLEPFWTNQNPFAILALNSERVTAVVAGLELNSEVVCGNDTRPQICVEASGASIDPSFILGDALNEVFPSARLITIYAWNWTPLLGLERHGFRKLQLVGNVVLDLRPGAQFLFDHFRKNRRRDIRLAMRSGVEISEMTTAEDLDAFWLAYQQWHQTKRKEIHHDVPLAKVEATINLRRNHRRFVARYKGEPIAASGFRFYQNGLVEYANNCSRDEYLEFAPNDLLLWKVIEWACEHGYPTLSLGGVHPFLAKWGGAVVPINRYRLDRTFAHWVTLKEDLARQGRKLVRKLPDSMQIALRKGLDTLTRH